MSLLSRVQNFSDTTFLPDFIRRTEQEANASGELSNMVLTIALATKIVSRGVNRAGIYSGDANTGEINVQGEEVKALDVHADSVFNSIIGRCGQFSSMVSEEQENLIAAKKGDANSKYVIAFDPVDGSSNIDVNVSIGTIWGIFERLSDGSSVDPNDTTDFLQAGHKQVAAGYTIYGSSTMFVFSTGQGVHGFTLYPTIGEFVLTHPNIQIPTTGSIYSCNEGNYNEWPKGVTAFIDWLKDSRFGPNGRPHSLRYVGSLVADFHRTMLKGGVFFYPADAKNKKGKLRLLYECAPLAFLADNAGGKASDGHRKILDIVPETIHERTPIFIGSAEMVERAESFMKEYEGV
jgi:fructose-1,6-bisphosphatase I